MVNGLLLIPRCIIRNIFFSYSAGCSRILSFIFFFFNFLFFISLLSSHLSTESGLMFLLFELSLLACFFILHFHLSSFSFSRYDNLFFFSITCLFLPALMPSLSLLWIEIVPTMAACKDTLHNALDNQNVPAG
jgi:hypothetical protein